ncbi:MAG: hypothetical protein IK104_11875 [Clostridia bacterium]|nr:hypothetical protein [Clostridia bacterium]
MNAVLFNARRPAFGVFAESHMQNIDFYRTRQIVLDLPFFFRYTETVNFPARYLFYEAA